MPAGVSRNSNERENGNTETNLWPPLSYTRKAILSKWHWAAVTFQSRKNTGRTHWVLLLCLRRSVDTFSFGAETHCWCNPLSTLCSRPEQGEMSSRYRFASDAQHRIITCLSIPFVIPGILLVYLFFALSSRNFWFRKKIEKNSSQLPSNFQLSS